MIIDAVNWRSELLSLSLSLFPYDAFSSCHPTVKQVMLIAVLALESANKRETTD